MFVLSCFLACCNPVFGIENGHFSDLETPPNNTQDPFNVWVVDPTFGDPPTEDNGEAKFEVGNGSSQRQLQQTFTAPANSETLTFQYRMETTGTLNANGDRDSFQATFLNPDTFEPLLAIDAPFFPSFFSVDNNGTQFLGSATSSVVGSEFTSVTADISTLSGQSVVLEFLVAENPLMHDDLTTTVWVDNVVVTAVPEPSAPVMTLTLFFGVFWTARRRRAK